MAKRVSGEKGEMIYYISDTHFGHQNIIRHCSRPFSSAEEMNETIISNWNKVVKPNDDVYHLGDVGHTSVNLVEILGCLNGKKHLVIGNHDRKPLKDRDFRKCFVEIHNMIEIADAGEQIVLCHYPLAEWNGYFKGTWHFYGHIHNSNNLTAELMSKIPRAINVSVEFLDYTPKTAKELFSIKGKD